MKAIASGAAAQRATGAHDEASRRRRVLGLLAIVAVVGVGLVHCSGGPDGDEKKRLAALQNTFTRVFVGPGSVAAPDIDPAAPVGAAELASASSAGAILMPLVEREADCSLTETLVDESTLTVTRRDPGFHLWLHARSGLATTPGVFPDGCGDPLLGVASTLVVVAGRRPNGDFFGATTLADEAGSLQALASRDRSALLELAQIAIRPAGTEYELESLATANLVGDANQDLVVALADFSVANGTGRVAVLRGKGKGKFGNPQLLALPFAARGVTIADFTGDGLLDVAAVGQVSSGSGVATFRNLGDGSFAAAVVAPGGASGRRIIAADLDGDDETDLATSGGHWLRGKGDGTFFAPVATGWQGQTLASGDFDGDDVLDVAVGGSDSGTQVAIFRGLGGGAFERGETYAGTLDPDSIAVGEIDGDGNLDLVIGIASGGLYGPTDGSGSVTSFLLGRGDGTFAGVPVRKGVLAVVADFDDDGRKDLLTAEDAGDTRFRLFRGKKQRLRFKAPVEFDEDFAVADLAVGKLDANASPDFVAFSRAVSVSDPGSLHVRLRQGAGFVDGDDVPLAIAPPVQNGRSIALGDVNRDGTLDVVAIGSLPGSGVERPGVLVVLLGLGDGTLGPASTIATNLLNPTSIVATNLDTASDVVDLVVLERGDPFAFPTKPGSVRVYAGNGDGTFVAPPVVLDHVPNPDALGVGDVNGDGLRDVLVAGTDGASGNTLQVSLRRASGRFAEAKVQKLVQFSTTGIAVGDLDRDGNADAVLSGCCGVAFTSYLLGKGNGKLDAEVFVPVDVAGSRPDLVNLDGDGRPELLLSLQARAGIALLRNMRVAP